MEQKVAVDQKRKKQQKLKRMRKAVRLGAAATTRRHKGVKAGKDGVDGKGDPALDAAPAADVD